MPDMHDEEKVSELPIGLLINFRRRKLEYQRLHQSEVFESEEETVEPIPFWDTCFFYHAYQAYPLYHVFLSFAAKFWDFLGIYHAYPVNTGYLSMTSSGADEIWLTCINRTGMKRSTNGLLKIYNLNHNEPKSRTDSVVPFGMKILPHNV